MIPASPKEKLNPFELGDFFQDEQDSQKSTVEKSSQVAQAVFSSPSQNTEDWALSRSLDFSDYRPGSSSLQLEDLFDDLKGYKRKGSPKGDAPIPKRFRLSELEGSEHLISVSSESGFLEPFEAEQESMPQLDGFSQMVDTWEVLAPSREEWMSGASQVSLDSHEEFTQLMQIEADSGLQESINGNEKEADEEIEERLPLLETVEKSEIKIVEKFDEKDRIVLNAIYQNCLLGYRKTFHQLKQKNVNITLKQVENVFIKYDLTTKKVRKAAHDAGWPGFKLLDSPIGLVPEKSVSLTGKRAAARIDDSMRREILKFALQNPEWGFRKIGKEFSKRGSAVSGDEVYKIFKEERLETPEQRKEKARNLKQLDSISQTEDQSLSDLLNLCKNAIHRSGISLGEPSCYEQSSYSLENFDREIRDEAALFESSEPTEAQSERSEIKDVEQFNEERMNDTDRIVLDIICRKPLLGFKAVFNLLKDKVEDLTVGKVESIFRKYDLGNKETRIAEAQAGWPRFKTLSLPTDSLPENSVILSRADMVEAVIEFYAENPRFSHKKIAEELTRQGYKISASSVGRILLRKQS